MNARIAILGLGLATALRASAAPIAAGPALSAEDAIREAVANNPGVRAAQAQYRAALHQIDQAYAPQDPQLLIQKSQTPNGLTRAQTQSVGISESFQFPGKAWLQGDQVHRTAEIARLTYQAAVRDATAQAQTSYYQALLDSASVRINIENVASVQEVLGVARIAYTANQNAQTDLISAQLALSQSSQSALASEVALANDQAALNQIMGRQPETPVEFAGELDLKSFELPLEAVKQRALEARQELLEAALTEKNAKTALKLAWMEFLPDFNVSWLRNNYPQGSINAVSPAEPSHDFSTSFGFNIPVFAWFKQREDVRAASNLLDAARRSRDGAELQTLTSVVQLHRSTLLAYKAALLYRDVLVPLAGQNLRVALIAYQSKKIDFTTLAGILQSLYSSRIAYLTAANQFLAGRVALEQAMGGPAVK